METFIKGKHLKRLQKWQRCLTMAWKKQTKLKATNQSKQPNKTTTHTHKTRRGSLNRIANCTWKEWTDLWALGSRNPSFKEKSVFNNHLLDVSQKQKRILLEEDYEVWDRDRKRWIYFGSVGCLHRPAQMQEVSALKKSGLLFIVPHTPFFEWVIES